MMNLPFSIPAPAGYSENPVWTGAGFTLQGTAHKVLEYSENFAGWDDNLTSLHEESAGEAHPIDIASRDNALQQLQKYVPAAQPNILEIGCSSGYMLKKLRRDMPNAQLVGADVVKDPLYKLSAELPEVPLLRFDLLQCPLPDNSFDAVIMLNVLEHIEDDTGALQRVFGLLKPGGVLILEIPAGPGLYDIYDHALRHYRRYHSGQLAQKLRKLGFEIKQQSHLGFIIYPLFALTKLMNKAFRSQQDATKLMTAQNESTKQSTVLQLACKIEAWLGQFVSFPYGIRCLFTVQKP